MSGVCLVVGAGDGLGAGIARAFAAEGLTVCVTRRPRHLAELEALAREIVESGGKARAFGLDARVEDEVVALFDTIEREVGPLEVVVFNIGANVRFAVTETTTRVYTKVWEMAAFAGFLAGREAARVMAPRGAGTILFTGATASVRGAAGFSAFAGAKHALRALAQSLARELGPKGVHVAHVVVDGAIDGAFIRGRLGDAAERLAREEILDPREIARNYVWLHQSTPERLDVRDGSAAVVGTLVRQMTKRLEFLFDFASLNAYLAYRALPPMLARTGAELVIEPCLLGGLFKLTGNQAPFVAFKGVKGKIEYEMLEVRRFINKHALTKYRMNPHFPVNTLMLMRGLVAARALGLEAAYIEMGLSGLWERGLKLDDPDTLAKAIDAAGLPAARLFEMAQTPEIKQALTDATARAAERGAFGIPTFFVGDEMFFGKERLGQVEEELTRAA